MVTDEVTPVQRDCIQQHRNSALIAMGLGLAIRLGGAYVGYRILGGGFVGAVGAYGGWQLSAPLAVSVSEPRLMAIANTCGLQRGAETNAGPRFIDV